MSSKYQDFIIPLVDGADNKLSQKSRPPLRRRRSIADLLPPSQIVTRSMLKDRSPLSTSTPFSKTEITPHNKFIHNKENTHVKQNPRDTKQKSSYRDLMPTTPLGDSNFLQIPATRIIKTPVTIGKPKRIPLTEPGPARSGVRSSARRVSNKERQIVDNSNGPNKERQIVDNSNPFEEAEPEEIRSTRRKSRVSGRSTYEESISNDMTKLSLQDCYDILSYSTPTKLTPKTQEKENVSTTYKVKVTPKSTTQETRNASNRITKPLRGVTAFVDVKTTDGDNASESFNNMLRDLGARVLKSYSDNVTHIVYKDGSQATVVRSRTRSDVKILSLQWVKKCHETQSHVDEAPYLISTSDLPTVRKRRKSMEPKSQATPEVKEAVRNILVNMQVTTPNSSVSSIPSKVHTESTTIVSTTTPRRNLTPLPTLTIPTKAMIDAVRRKSLPFAPKISSPLARQCWNAQ